MPKFTRGADTEVASRKEVEQLMSVLSQKQVNIPNQVLQRAIVMPKDLDPNLTTHPTVRSQLLHNPFGTPQYKAAEAARKKEEAREKLLKELEAAKVASKKKKKQALEVIVEAV